MSLRKMLRLFHTVRHLKIEQLIYRLYYRFAKVYLTERREYGQRPWLRTWSSPGLLPSRMLARGSFEFLGEQGYLKDKDAWNDPHKSKLWLYNLHYLDDLNAVGAGLRREEHKDLINRWIAENPPVMGHGWEPYPLSLRIVNLVKWFSRQNVIEPTWQKSLGLQTQALYQQLEFHILGNHLFANAKALVFAGAFLDGDEAQKWLQKGLQILDREIPEQFLPDGGHFELSPMYHAILLGDMCDLLSLAERSGLSVLRKRVSGWREVINRGLTWLAAMSHPDGRIAFFNDSAFDIAPDPEAIKAYAASLGCKAEPVSLRSLRGDRKVSFQWLGNSGYCRVEMSDGDVALLDMARIGPDYLPAHGHADTLSFELSLFGRRVFVNSGTSQYGEGVERQRQRSTAAHNTVVVDGEPSSEVWGGFRVARRAFPSKPYITEDDESAVVVASHDGYKRLQGKAIHRRSWTFTRRSLVMHDSITGNFQSAVVRFYLHPDIGIDRRHLSDCQLLLISDSEKTIRFGVQGADGIELVESTWHPKFGTSVPNICIVAKLSGHNLTTRIEWGSDI
ncbi:MAG: heparinase II/III family protein [Sulfuricaulis sp.]|uniref:heparinase II/III family protein n=1 Tax=Sulfuricaulis sp. TaxID=2003553 RepID=UPI0025F3B855|nr:alginate lyase family protein [Sulfuricaulis sp.]MCR4348001.1 heparinase II/III family protein [Sulfuricaulis sp.]